MMNEIIENMTFKDYRAVDAVHKHDLDSIRVAPAKYRHEQDNEGDDTEALLYGRLVDQYFEAPELFDSMVCVLAFDNFRTKEARQARDDAIASGKDVCNLATMAEIKQLYDTAMQHPGFALAAESGRKQLSLFWEMEGIQMAGRPDYVIETDKGYDVIFDLKTTKDASRDSFSRSILTYRYHVQAALYCAGWKAITGRDAQFVYAAIEKTPPYLHGCYYAEDIQIELGMSEAKEDIATLKHCIETGKWPSYNNCIEPIELPAWALKKGI